MSILSGVSNPGTTITTTAETVVTNIPATPLTEPPASPQTVIVRGGVWITTGTGVTQLSVKLRVGQNNTTTAQVGSTDTEVAAASTLLYVPFEFIDAVAGDLVNSGYTLTVVQVGATGNGAVTSVTFEVDYSAH